MTEAERLRRIDESLAKLERSTAGIEREVELTREFMNDQRTYNDQVVARMERSARDGMRELSRRNDDLERQGRELERQGARWETESRMGRAALLRVLDRLDETGPGPSAAPG